ncbi:hypothetical protein TraAM80_06029 [Trypanosoma rangeli]|uniref:Uncharacterized protein n=1 Tax=Trypanosoma rangeli TaxID=5698 RepID=A0A3R7MID2_TRYRA|nr:uncharacterized protein TraAM80_06029 [Trypanosoma rangeli]RNF03028.1 hypothetical protein TraAM80_06029 [Trypanosoma rangeli]|eukprot:RNF03028.1 hypothetical protein TraAM80_06029 [Trypanosoma rangeli]
MAIQCVSKCDGYRSLRAECARDPCLAQGMCKLMDAGIRDCAEWCCVGRGGYVFLVVLFFCGGTCALFSMYYLWRLHQANVAAGAVTDAGEKISAPPDSDPSTVAAQRRKKRQVTVDPELLMAVGVTPPEVGELGVGRYR